MLLNHLIILLILASFGRMDFPESLFGKIKEYFTTGQEPDGLVQALLPFKMPGLLDDGLEDVYDHSKTCMFCNLLVNLVIAQRRTGANRETIAKESEFFCVHLGNETERFCKGAINLNLDVFLYIVDNSPQLDSHRVCGTILQSHGCHGKNFDWSVNLPSGNSPQIRPNYNQSTSFKILQLSDIHYDLNYTANGNAECGEYACCQKDQGEASSPQNACGYWSDYRRSDLPWHLVEETIKQVKTHKFDFIYYTGDVVNHRIWETSIESNKQVISKLYSYFKSAFNVPVYPVLGNHEPHPINLWPPQNLPDAKFSNEWLFDLIGDLWSDLVGEDIRDTVLKGGYYTVSPYTGFRIIVINSNPCYTFNWWLLWNDVDPYGQLQWLADTLFQAETNNEKVHILSHVPSGTSECLSIWAREYSRIVERFANTITGQFNGHTHKDEFYVFHNSSKPTQAIGAAFNGASVTPWTDSNPSYKIYDIDSSTFDVLDYAEWTFNLTLANLRGSNQIPEWYQLYRFTDTFGVDNLSTSEIEKLLHNMAQNHKLLDVYFTLRNRNSDPVLKKSCDDSCKKKYLCQIVTTAFGVDTQCKHFIGLYDKEE
ncbi:sphingomyelin phosphodiesterase-like [Tribolium madens]|uniref:sphingomyelin phosphodiesterase-like n=1 Tax=Tribolium madens TaxID=41895 RepID=UPI001CF751C6|nr:sphingomyelin phosphodiesterase-like [Tribolium madens]